MPREARPQSARTCRALAANGEKVAVIVMVVSPCFILDGLIGGPPEWWPRFRDCARWEGKFLRMDRITPHISILTNLPRQSHKPARFFTNGRYRRHNCGGLYNDQYFSNAPSYGDRFLASGCRIKDDGQRVLCVH